MTAAQDFAHPLDDPKFAIRLGCADAGILTQFVLVPKKAKRYNSERTSTTGSAPAGRTGYAKLGVRVLPEHTPAAGIPKDSATPPCGWSGAARTSHPAPRQTPVAVMVTPLARRTGIAVVAGWDPKAAQWIPYPRFLLKLVKIAEIPDIDDDLEAETPGNEAVPTTPQDGQNSDASAGSRRPATYRVWKQNMDEQRRETERYLHKMLRSLRGHPTVLLTHSQNSRVHWPWLQDGRTNRT